MSRVGRVVSAATEARSSESAVLFQEATGNLGREGFVLFSAQAHLLNH